MTKESLSQKNRPGWTQNIFVQILGLIGVLFLFLVSLELMGGSFKLFGKGLADQMINTAKHPLIALFVGMLATAIIQSSSTTTTLIVTMVASAAVGANGDPEAVKEAIKVAVPMIMGANIGTSVTSTIISLGHIGNKKEYRKAIAAATVHDFFNIITVLILLPLELIFGLLSDSAIFLAEHLFTEGEKGEKMVGILGYTVKPVAKFILHQTGKVGAMPKGNPFVALPLALLMLFLALRWLTKLLKNLIIGRVQSRMDKILFGNPLMSLLWGVGITTLVQSSSVTSSLTVPLVATGKASLRKVFPFLMGANIGTTTTALIAAMVGESSAGLAIAFCHLFFNLFGVLILFPIPPVRMIPVRLSRMLGRLTLKNRLFGIGYIVITFFVLPLSLILATGFSFSKDENKENPAPKTEQIVPDSIESSSE